MKRHIYNPWGDNVRPDGQLVIDQSTIWYQACDSSKTLTHQKYLAGIDRDIIARAGKAMRDVVQWVYNKRGPGPLMNAALFLEDLVWKLNVWRFCKACQFVEWSHLD